MARRAHAPKRWRIEATCWLAAYLLDWLFGAFHLASAHHDVCARDGNLVHGECSHALGRTAGTAPSLLQVSAFDPAHDPEHEPPCRVLAQSKAHSQRGPSLTLLQAPERPAETLDDARLTVPRARWRAWLLAPKQSPPRTDSRLV